MSSTRETTDAAGSENAPRLRADLQTDLLAGVASLREALLEVLEAARLHQERRPRSLAAKLGVDPKLAWRVVHLTGAECTLETARYVPGPGSLRTLFRSLAEHGATPAQCERIAQASERFEAAVTRHVGTRRGLDTFLASIARDPHDATAIELRRAGFESNASGLGIRAASQDLIAATFIGDNPEKLDVVGLRATMGLELLRPRVPWRIAVPYTDDRSIASRTHIVEPLVPTSNDRTGLHIVEELCSSPIPDFTAHRLKSGNVEYELRSGALGIQGRQDLVFADHWKQCEPALAPAPDDRSSRLISRMRVPCERARWVLCAPADLFVSDIPTTQVFTTMWRGDTSFEEGDRLPIDLAIHATDADAVCAGDPRLGEMLRWLLERIGHHAENWVITIAELTYPPLMSAAAFRWDRKLPSEAV